MRSASEQARRLLPGAVDLTYEADIMYGAERLEANVPLSNLTLRWDGTAKVEGSGSCDIVRSPLRGESWIPNQPGDMLSPFGTELVISARVRVSQLLDERIPLGVFPIAEVPESQAGYATIGNGTYVVGERIALVFKDRMHNIVEDKFTRPEGTGSAATCYAELGRLSGRTVVRTVPDKAIRGGILYDDKRDEAIERIAAFLGGDPFFNSAGALQVRPDTPGSVVATLDVDQVAPLSAALSTEGVHNGVVVTGKAEDGSEIKVVRFITTGPLARTRWRQVPMFYHSDMLYTEALVGAEADRQLAQLSKPATRLVETTILPHPLLEVGDVVQLRQLSGSLLKVRIQSLGLARGAWTLRGELL